MTSPFALAARRIATATLLVAGVAGIVLFVAGGRAPPAARHEHVVISRVVPPAQPRPASISSIPGPTSTPLPVVAPLIVRRVLDTGGPIRYGTYFWDEGGAPTAGRVVVTVDLTAMTLSIFRDGYEIGTAAVIRGLDRAPTPLGTFPILMKDADHHSATYGGAPMPYTLRLTPDGVSIHGSGTIAYDAGTHGCIGVPIAFARKLFAATRVGDPVIITDGKTLAVTD